MKKEVLFVFLLVFFPLYACEKADLVIPYDWEESVDMSLRFLPENRFAKVDSTEWVYAIPDKPMITHTGVEAVKLRAQQMATIAWRPKNGDIPSRYGVYAEGTIYTGIPYSLAIWTDTHVGTQTSLFTYLTAVDNPGSVLYTEDLRRPPYSGFDCAPYYGSTCSNSVMYAFGIEPPIYTYMIPSLPGIQCLKEQSSESIESCDILLKPGHVVMVFNVNRGADGKLQHVRIFETTSEQGHDTWFRDFSADEFKKWWEKGKYVRYRYKFIDDVTYSPSPLVPLNGEIGITNYRSLEVCTTLGDGVTYWHGHDVIITPVAKGYKTIVVFKDESLFLEKPIHYPATVLSDLPCGEYKVHLSDAEGYYSSHFTRFEIIDAQVSGTKDEMLRITFASEMCSPRYICICNGTHDPYNYYSFSDSTREQGLFEMPAVHGERTTHFKVYFKGKYNTIATELKGF